jgi:hypothetical protein
MRFQLLAGEVTGIRSPRSGPGGVKQPLYEGILADTDRLFVAK